MVMFRKSLVRKHALKSQPSQVGDRECPAAAAPPPVVRDINALAKTWKERLGLWRKPKAGQALTVASDCSGYGSELLALRLLGLQAFAKPVMVCESDKSKVTLHRAMSELCDFDTRECTYYSDIFARCNENAPRADLYTAGYPCPSYSRLGKRQGTGERRGLVTLQGLLYYISLPRDLARSCSSRSPLFWTRTIARCGAFSSKSSG